jgi:hypothetical protein
MDRDLYGVLGVPSTASEAEIRHAFRELAKRRHPDVNRDDPDAAREFIEVSNAADILLDPRRRAAYDARTRPVAPSPRPPEPPRPAPKPAPRPAPRQATAPPATGMSAFGVAWRILVLGVITVAILVLANGPKRHSGTQGPANGTVIWKATGFRLSDGWGINLAGHGARLQVFLGMSTDLEVGNGYLSSAGHIIFLTPGLPPSYSACLFLLALARRGEGQVSDQAVPLIDITPGTNGDLCSSGSSGDVAFIRVTRNDPSGISMDITVWKNI